MKSAIKGHYINKVFYTNTNKNGGSPKGGKG
jgi:hypothetical protein